MKVVLIVFCLILNSSFGQNDDAKRKKIIQSGRIESSEGTSYVFECDRNGNRIFSKNVGMNGPVTMIFAFDFDSLNRATMLYSVHSNLGFSVSETEYHDNRVFRYSYASLADDKTQFDQESLTKFKTKEDFMSLSVIENLRSGTRSLTHIDVLNSDGNVVESINISKDGDTSSMNFTEYDSLGRESIYHFGVDATNGWSWDIYNVFDDSSNLVQSYRISEPNAGADTTEVRNYRYDELNRPISKDYYYRNSFKNRTEYLFKKNGDVIELFFEGSEDELKVKTIYKHNREGNVRKKIKWNYRSPKKEQKSVTKNKYEYWYFKI